MFSYSRFIPVRCNLARGVFLVRARHFNHTINGPGQQALKAVSEPIHGTIAFTEVAILIFVSTAGPGNG